MGGAQSRLGPGPSQEQAQWAAGFGEEASSQFVALVKLVNGSRITVSFCGSPSAPPHVGLASALLWKPFSPNALRAGERIKPLPSRVVDGMRWCVGIFL